MSQSRWRFHLPAWVVLAFVGPLQAEGRQGETRRPILGQPIEKLPPAKEKPIPPPFGDAIRAMPINLQTALRLAEAAPLDIAVADQLLQVAAARLQRAERLWLPTLYLGADYYRHDGQLQDVAGNVFGASKSTLMMGVGPSMVFAFSDAMFEPLAARRAMQARSAGVQTAQNDTFLLVAEAYFNVLQARGDLLGATDTLRRGEDLLKRTEKKVALGLVPPLETARVRADVARRRQSVQLIRERWKVASAQLGRVLRLDPGAVIEPVEPPDMQVPLVNPKLGVDELIPVALTSRPELATGQALVQATLARLRQERLRPLIPSLLIRGTASNPTGTFSTAYFGGGKNARIGDFSWRNDIDVQVVWELQNLGLGNRARVNERRAENQLAVVELFRLQDQIAAEVAAAHAQVETAAARIRDAEAGLKDALFSVEKNFEGLDQTRRVGDNVIILLIRPQEAVSSVQALSQAYADYYGAVADFNRAQFRLYRALGTAQGSAGSWLFNCKP